MAVSPKARPDEKAKRSKNERDGKKNLNGDLKKQGEASCWKSGPSMPAEGGRIDNIKKKKREESKGKEKMESS